MKNYNLFVAALLLVSLQALASDGRSNGGDAVVCFRDKATRTKVAKVLLDNADLPVDLRDPVFADKSVLDKVSSVSLLDIYQKTTAMADNTLKAYDPSASFEDILEDRLQVLEKISNLGNVLRETLVNYIPIENWHGEAGLSAISDSQHVQTAGPLCLVVQFAYRVSNQVFVDDNLLKKMNQLNGPSAALHQAALFLHEALFYHLADDRFKAGPLVRTVIGKIFGASFDGLNSRNFFNWFQKQIKRDLSKQYGFPNHLGLGKISIFGTTIFFNNWNQIESDSISYKFDDYYEINIPQGRLAVHGEAVVKNGRPTHFNKATGELQLAYGKLNMQYYKAAIDLDDSGRVVSIYFKQFSGALTKYGWAKLADKRHFLWPNGVFKTIELSLPQVFTVAGISFEVDHVMEFHSNGVVKRLRLAKKQSFRGTRPFKERTLPEGTILLFDDHENFIGFGRTEPQDRK